MTEPTRPLAPPQMSPDGCLRFTSWTSPQSFAVRGACPIPSRLAIPIIFVPGIMGSNLKANRDNRSLKPGAPAWRPPNGVAEKLGSLKVWKSRNPAQRQTVLNPAGTEVDAGGPVKLLGYSVERLNPETARNSGWGEVHLESYGAILNYLVGSVNRVFERSRQAGKRGPVHAHWQRLLDTGTVPADYRLTEAELLKHARYQYPVYACGYNWLQSNADSAKRLAAVIDQVIEANNRNGYTCTQVILVTHSMGGLVARACAKLYKEKEILGIVHGVLPAIGAPAAYRRIAAGTETTSPSNGYFANLATDGFATIAGKTPAETVPVMASSPGALELLPNHLYPSPWLKVTVHALRAGQPHHLAALPQRDPYDEIYREKDKLYRLVDENLIDPAGLFKQGDEKIDPWTIYEQALGKAEAFHKKILGNYYHPNTYAYYGADRQQLSFGSICWQAKDAMLDAPSAQDFKRARLIRSLSGQRSVCIDPVSLRPAALPDVAKGIDMRLVHGQVLDFRIAPQDAPGDGTVPIASGLAPTPHVKKIAKLTGFDHQGSYNDDGARDFVLHAICKIVQQAT